MAFNRQVYKKALTFIQEIYGGPILTLPNIRKYLKLSKTIYRPRYKLYFLHRSLVMIITGLIDIVTTLFHFESVIYSNFCDRNFKRDVERTRDEKKARAVRKKSV